MLHFSTEHSNPPLVTGKGGSSSVKSAGVDKSGNANMKQRERGGREEGRGRGMRENVRKFPCVKQHHGLSSVTIVDIDVS